MDIQQGQGQHQRLLINLAMRQAFAVLKMPILELGQWVEQQIVENPLLEKVESRPYVEAAEQASPVSLYMYLMQQVCMGDFEDKEKLIAGEIIGNLDERGFYLGPTAGRMRVLKKVQQLDPPGIGATSLQESLLIQLEARGEKGSPLYLKIRDHFEDCFRELKGLNFAPALAFDQRRARPLVPDVIVDESIHISDEGIPEFTLSPSYESYQAQGVDARYLRRHVAEAKWLVRNLEKRGSTLKAITHLLFEKDPHYFLGASKRIPKTTVSEIASILEVNPSTVSRAINEKTLLSRNGLVPFKAFFSRSEPKELLKELIESELRVHSDEELAKELGIARRTVAKYRKELGILNSRSRRS